MIHAWLKRSGLCLGKRKIDNQGVENDEDYAMNISFEISHDIEQQLRTDGADLNRETKEVYLMEQYRQAKLSHRQLQEALGLSFHATEQLLKKRGLGQDLEIDEFEAGRNLTNATLSKEYE